MAADAAPDNKEYKGKSRSGGGNSGGGGGGGFNPLTAIAIAQKLLGGFGGGRPQMSDQGGYAGGWNGVPMPLSFMPGQGPGRDGGGLRGLAAQVQQRLYGSGMGPGAVMPYPGQFWRHGNVQWQVPQWSAAPSPGFNTFLNAMYGRFGQPSPGYQAFLQALQERRDARIGVPAPPPQGAASPSAQRAVPAMQAGFRSF